MTGERTSILARDLEAIDTRPIIDEVLAEHGQ